VNETDPTGAQTMAAEGALLLDVREDEEWAVGHAPEARHMPLSALDPAALPADAAIAVICRSGARSGKAQVTLAEAGLSVTNVAGGMLAWARDGLPVVTDSGDPGTVLT